MLRETKIFKFCDQVKQEAAKVIWPTKKELVAATSIVIGAVCVFSIICIILDYSIHTLIQMLLNLGKQG